MADLYRFAQAKRLAIDGVRLARVHIAYVGDNRPLEVTSGRDVAVVIVEPVRPADEVLAVKQAFVKHYGCGVLVLYLHQQIAAQFLQLVQVCSCAKEAATYI